MISDPADLRTIRNQAEALSKAQKEICRLKNEESHRVMCLQAEVTARNAANVELQLQVDILERGLDEAKLQIAMLKRLVPQEDSDEVPRLGEGAVLQGRDGKASTEA